MFVFVLLCVHSSFAIILKRKRKLFAQLLLSYRCLVTVNVLWLFLPLPWVGLQCVIEVFPDHSYLPFSRFSETQLRNNSSTIKEKVHCPPYG